MAKRAKLSANDLAEFVSDAGLGEISIIDMGHNGDGVFVLTIDANGYEYDVDVFDLYELAISS